MSSTESIVLLKGRGRTLDAQRRAVRHLIEGRSPVCIEVVQTGRRSTGIDRVLKQAHDGQVETLIVASIEHLGATAVEAITVLGQLHATGVNVASVQEPWAGSATPALADVAKWLLERESRRRSSKAKRSVSQARNRLGVRLGRPRAQVEDLQSAAARVRMLGFRRAAAEMVPRIGETTLRRLLKNSGLLCRLPAPPSVSTATGDPHA